ncbi:uncharacterized protein LOC105850990 [Hydra vulgaris]|uniref:uncharacterized protein LOC105850990 n=1 Tax=Hydra vulgaris TaxID=6087 RepID=UPI000640D2EC|nr:uncharacterized protein LOC105850990 [Hydra vulgaris]
MTTGVTILKMLEGLDQSKAMGFDEIIPYVVKLSPEGFVDPIVYIFKLSFKTGCVRYQWSVVNISPIYKGRSKLDPGNYRPVSLTSVICKMFKKLIRGVILEHLVSNGLISDEQTCFVPNKSSTTNLIETIDTIT